MKSDRLCDAVGQIEDALLEEAADPGVLKKRPRQKFLKGAAACACLCLLAFGCLRLWAERSSEETSWPTRVIWVEPNTVLEIIELPHWEDRSTPERFSSFTYDGHSYEMTGGRVAEALKGEALSRITLQGSDYYSEKEYTAAGEIFALRGTSEDCALLLRFDGEETLYSYLCYPYSPQTLGELIREFRMEEELTLSGCRLSFRDEKSGKWRLVSFETADCDAIWRQLTAERDLENTEKEEYGEYSRELSFAVSLPSFGITNKALEILDSGWLLTNVGETRKAFFLGEEKAKAVMDFVTASYDGVEIIYTLPEELREEKTGEEELAAETVIMTAVSP